MNYFEDEVTTTDTYVYRGQLCKLSYKDAHIKNYALGLNRSPYRYVKVDTDTITEDKGGDNE
jgi:hypothetical protein